MFSFTVYSVCSVFRGRGGKEADGGNHITKYIVEWDTIITFNSGNSLPHAGEKIVSAHPSSLAGALWNRYFLVNQWEDILLCSSDGLQQC